MIFHIPYCEQASGCYSKLPTSQGCIQSPIQCRPKPCHRPPKASQSFQETRKTVQNRPQIFPKPSRTSQSRPEICGARPEPSTTCQNKLELLTQSFVHRRNCRAERVILQMRCSMGQSLHVKCHLGGAGTHAAGVRDNIVRTARTDSNFPMPSSEHSTT